MSEPSPQPFRQDMPRASQEFVAHCYAVDLIFDDEALWPDALFQDMTEHNGIPCEGSGVPGLWCEDCRFGVLEDV